MKDKGKTGTRDAASVKTQVHITPKKRVTMTDVARLAGCSQSTVSIVLNDTPGIAIAGATRKRVRAAADKLGYAITRHSPAIETPARQIAVIFDYLATSPEAVEAIDGVREAAWPGGQIVAAYQTLNDEEMMAQTIAAVLSPGVAGIVFATIMTREVTIPTQLRNCGKPLALLNCYTHDRSLPCVLPGEVAGGYVATRTLTNAGHQRIAHITGEMWMDAAKSRLKGYRQALASAGIAFNSAFVKTGDWSISAGRDRTLELLDSEKRPTAIFCANDRTAVGAYEAIKARGLRIPQDISVIGYDDQEISRHLSPGLTTLILPHREMGQWACQSVSEAAESNNRTRTYPLIKLECTLVERESVAPPVKT